MDRVKAADADLRLKLSDEAAPVRAWLTRYFHRRVQNISEVEDLVQDVFARMVARDSNEPIAHLGAYVLKTAASVFADWLRRRSSHAAKFHVSIESSELGETEVSPERIWCGKEDLQAATVVLLQMPERTRTVFVLRRLEGWKVQEIAAHLGISASAVEKHMLRAVQQLCLEVEKRRGT